MTSQSGPSWDPHSQCSESSPILLQSFLSASTVSIAIYSASDTSAHQKNIQKFTGLRNFRKMMNRSRRLRYDAKLCEKHCDVWCDVAQVSGFQSCRRASGANRGEEEDDRKCEVFIHNECPSRSDRWMIYGANCRLFIHLRDAIQKLHYFVRRRSRMRYIHAANSSF